MSEPKNVTKILNVKFFDEFYDEENDNYYLADTEENRMLINKMLAAEDRYCDDEEFKEKIDSKYENYYHFLRSILENDDKTQFVTIDTTVFRV